MTHEPSAEDATRLALDEAKSLARRALERSGLAASHAIAVAAQHVAADRDGIPSHGIARIPSCCELIPIGKIKGDAVPRIASPRPGLIQVDSDDGFPHLAIETGTPPLCEAARRNGVAAMMVANGYHCGVLGYHTEHIAASGLVVIGFTAAPASIAPSGGTRPVIGTNPISCAVPCENGPPLVIDQSSSVVAKSEVIDRHQRGEAIPSHWAFDRDGNPTSSAAEALQGGTMAPAGGYKGFGIGLIVEVFAALLTGSSLGIEAAGLLDKKSGPSRVGQCFIAVDPGPTAGDSLPRRVTRLIDAIAQQDGTRLPGSRRLAMREKAVSGGITIPTSLHRQLLALAGEAGAA